MTKLPFPAPMIALNQNLYATHYFSQRLVDPVHT